jgi:hypothetical protein
VHGRYTSRRRVDPDGSAHTGLVERPRNQWPVLINDHHEGDIRELCRTSLPLSVTLGQQSPARYRVAQEAPIIRGPRLACQGPLGIRVSSRGA